MIAALKKTRVACQAPGNDEIEDMARLLIVDPVCAQAIGHNVAVNRYFRDFFLSKFDDVKVLCAKALPSEVVAESGFVPFFNFYYHEYIPGISKFNDHIDLSSKNISIDLENIATGDARRLFTEYNITSEDTILFPSVDFYGVIGILNAIGAMDPGNTPRLALRFIGVMENGTRSYRNPLDELVRRIKFLDGVRILISAEVPSYADRLAKSLKQCVPVTPYPENGDQIPLNRSGAFIFYCPGSARLDKGFLSLHEIFKSVRRQDPTLKIKFVTQVLPDNQIADHQSYINALYALPGVKLLPSKITHKEMRDQYSRCHAVLLPYEAHIYESRGSAVVMEAASLGRPVLAVGGTGFASTLDFYGLGVNVSTVGDLPAAIVALAGKSRQTIEIQAKQARQRFLNDATASYRSWLENQ